MRIRGLQRIARSEIMITQKELHEALEGEDACDLFVQDDFYERLLPAKVLEIRRKKTLWGVVRERKRRMG